MMQIFLILYLIIITGLTIGILMWGITFHIALLMVLTWFSIIFCCIKGYWRLFFILSIFLLVNNVLFSYVIFNAIIENYCEMLIAELVYSLENSLLVKEQVIHLFIPVDCSNINFELFENSKPINFLLKRHVVFKSIILSTYSMAFCSVTLYDTPFIDLLLIETIPKLLIPFVKQHLLNNSFCGHISLQLANILES